MLVILNSALLAATDCILQTSSWASDVPMHLPCHSCQGRCHVLESESRACPENLKVPGRRYICQQPTSRSPQGERLSWSASVAPLLCNQLLHAAASVDPLGML